MKTKRVLACSLLLIIGFFYFLSTDDEKYGIVTPLTEEMEIQWMKE